MPVTPVPPMTDIPPFPALSDRADGSYNSKAFAFGSHMADTFNDELVAVANSVAQNAALTASGAAIADASAQAAIAAVGVLPWVSGQTYQANACAISQVNFQTYRRIASGAGSTDPANDATNWRMLSGNNANGTFAANTVAALEIDLSLGNYFTKTISANSTFTFKNVPAGGCGFTLDLTTTAAVIVAFPSSVKTSGNASPPFLANKSYLLMFITANGGSRWRLVVAPNFDI